MNLPGMPVLFREFDLADCFTQVSEQILYKDEVRDVFRTACSRQTCDAIFGPFDLFRNWHGLRYGAGRIRSQLRQKRQQPGTVAEPPLILPNDAVVISRSAGQVVVVASSIQQRVVKLETHVHARHFQEIAKHTCEAFRRAGMERHVPALLDSGETNGIFYAVSEFCPNRPPFFRSIHGRAWPKVLAEKLIPILQGFHLKNGVEVMDGPAWAERLRSKMAGRCIRPEMLPAWERILDELAADFSVRMPLCMISGDLQPQNIHFHQGEIKILDWSNMEQSALITDVFCDIFYRGMVNPETAIAAGFWQFLAGETTFDSLPPVMRDTSYVWRTWLASWFGIKVDEAMLRTQLRGMCWDWLVTMTHPWLTDGSLWRQIRFPRGFVEP